jgi:6-phosphogluconate dehydrogenase
MRSLSSFKELRLKISSIISGPYSIPSIDSTQITDDMKNAIYVAILVTYAQGMGVISAASRDFEWDVCMSDVIGIWKGGCIIRGRVLSLIQNAFLKDSSLSCLLADDIIAAEVNVRLGSLRRVVTLCIATGVPCPALSAAISYIDILRCTSLPTNLIQAQRDFFGAHTYERVDLPGTFHSDWTDNDT